MTNPNDDALVEQVEEAMWMADIEPYDPENRIPFREAPETAQAYCRAEARAAIAVLRPVIRAEALREAAKVADRAGQEPPTGNLMHDAGWDNATLVISAAILALIDKA